MLRLALSQNPAFDLPQHLQVRFTRGLEAQDDIKHPKQPDDRIKTVFAVGAGSEA
jgi:hypothetical protein